MKRSKRGIGTIATVVVIIVVIAIIAGVGAWYLMGGEEEPTNGGPINGDGNGDGNGNGNGEPGPAPSVIKIGWPTCISGPLSPFGEPDMWIAERMEKRINGEGGIYLSKYDQKVPIEILIRDTESNPKTAASVADSLVTKDKVDILLVLHTPDTTLPVCGIAEKYNIPTVSLDTPVEAWLSGAPYEWCYHVFFQGVEGLRAAADMFNIVREDTNEVIGMLLPQDPDGRFYANHYKEIFEEEEGYETVFTGHFPPDLMDFSEIISEFKEKNVDIIWEVCPPPTFHRFLRQTVEMNYHPKIVHSPKADVFYSGVAALEDLATGITTQLFWGPEWPYKSSITGETAQEFAAAYEEDLDKPWATPMGLSYAGFEIIVDAIERAGELNKEKLIQAIANTELETMVGTVDFKDIPTPEDCATELALEYRDRFSTTPFPAYQWQTGEKWKWEPVLIANGKWDELPEYREKLIFPYPGYGE